MNHNVAASNKCRTKWLSSRICVQKICLCPKSNTNTHSTISHCSNIRSRVVWVLIRCRVCSISSRRLLDCRQSPKAWLKNESPKSNRSTQQDANPPWEPTITRVSTRGQLSSDSCWKSQKKLFTKDSAMNSCVSWLLICQKRNNDVLSKKLGTVKKRHKMMNLSIWQAIMSAVNF